MSHPVLARPMVSRIPSLRVLRLVHPFPTALNVAATAGLALVASRGSPDVGVLARMMGLMLCAQSAIGVTNDIFDRDLDAATKPWKPIPAGVVNPTGATVAAVVLLGAVVAIGATLGIASLSLAIAGTACGLAYDVRFKRTTLSALPYMAAIPLLPLWVWATVGEWHDVLLWLLPLGAFIGLALHLANTLPDIDDDAAHGVCGLAHALGAQRSMYVAWTSFASALAISLAIIPLVGYDLRLLSAAVSAGVVCLAGSIGAYLLRSDGAALQFGFGVLSIGAVVLAVGWLAAMT